jgi:hypothetical protein
VKTLAGSHWLNGRGRSKTSEQEKLNFFNSHEVEVTNSEPSHAVQNQIEFHQLNATAPLMDLGFQDDLWLPLVNLVTRFCGHQSEPRWRYYEDDDRNKKCPRPPGLMGRVVSWMDGRDRPRKRAEDDRGSDRYVGQSSRSRRVMQHDLSSPPSCGMAAPDERRALRSLCQAKGEAYVETVDSSKRDTTLEAPHFEAPDYGMEPNITLGRAEPTDTIVLTPHSRFSCVTSTYHGITQQSSEVIEIIPQPLPMHAQFRPVTQPITNLLETTDQRISSGLANQGGQ